MQDTKITSLPAAAFIVAHGRCIQRIEEVSPERFAFIFEGDTSKLLDSYFGGGLIAARDFYRALQSIRSAINHAKNGGGQ